MILRYSKLWVAWWTRWLFTNHTSFNLRVVSTLASFNVFWNILEVPAESNTPVDLLLLDLLLKYVTTSSLSLCTALIWFSAFAVLLGLYNDDFQLTIVGLSKSLVVLKQSFQMWVKGLTSSFGELTNFSMPVIAVFFSNSTGTLEQRPRPRPCGGGDGGFRPPRVDGVSATASRRPGGGVEQSTLWRRRRGVSATRAAAALWAVAPCPRPCGGSNEGG